MDTTPKELIPFVGELKKIHEHLNQILNKWDEQIASINAAAESRDKNRQVKPFWLDQVLSEYQELVTDKKDESNRQHLTQRSLKRAAWCTFWATLAAFGAAAYYAHWARLTYIEVAQQTSKITESARASERSAKAAEDAVSDARKNFLSDERPYVWVTSMSNPYIVVGDPALWKFNFANYGKTPAIRLLSRAEIVISDPNKPLSPTDEYSQAVKRVFAPLHAIDGNRAKGVILPQVSSASPVEPKAGEHSPASGQGMARSKHPVTADEFAWAHTAPVDGIVSLLIYFEYYDSAGNQYRSEICQYWLRRGDVAPCPIHNEIH